MEKLTIKEIILSTNGKLLQKNNNDQIKSIIIDNRHVEPDCLFIPIIGEVHDGHKFMESAYENGCKNFLIDENHNFFKEDINLIEVTDTKKALGQISKAYKEKFKIPFIGVTGSVGKTSTKDMIYSVLKEKYNTLKTKENYNNDIGLPKTILNLTKENEIAIIEMGMDKKGEISYLANIVNPNIAVITNIGISHIEHFENQEGIFNAKMEITENLTENDILIVNGDDNYLKKLKTQKKSYKLITCGFQEDNDIYCSKYQIKENTIEFETIYNNKKDTFTIPTLAKHNILNAMIAIVIGQKYNMNEKEIKKGLLNYEASSNRLNIIKTASNTIINDTYNASFDSMKSALEVLGTFKTRKVAILGDIFELGSLSEKIHTNVGKLIESDILITIGTDSKYIGKGATDKGFNVNNYYHFDNKEKFYKEAKNIIKKDDTILVKASRGMKLEEIVEFLKA